MGRKPHCYFSLLLFFHVFLHNEIRYLNVIFLYHTKDIYFSGYSLALVLPFQQLTNTYLKWKYYNAVNFETKFQTYYTNEKPANKNKHVFLPMGMRICVCVSVCVLCVFLCCVCMRMCLCLPASLHEYLKLETFYVRSIEWHWSPKFEKSFELFTQFTLDLIYVIIFVLCCYQDIPALCTLVIIPAAMFINYLFTLQPEMESVS